MNIDKLQIGDIVNYKPTGWNDFLGHILRYGGKYAHTSTISKINKNTKEITIIEAHLTSGVVEKILNPKWYKSIEIRRINGGLSLLEKRDLKIFLRTKLDKKYGLSDFADVIYGLLFGGRHKESNLNDPDRFFCTELTATAYNHINRQIVKGIHYSRIIPSDLGSKNSLTEKVVF